MSGASFQVAVTWFRTGYRRHINCPELRCCPYSWKPFHVAHILVSCTTMDQSAIVRNLNLDNGLSDTGAALAILKRMALDSWEPLAKFYRQNYNIIGTVGDPVPQSDQEDE